MNYQEVKGDLIDLTYQGKFDVITHGCNCWCNMGAGIAVPMARNFGVNDYELEKIKYRGDINKLGQIDWEKQYLNSDAISVYIVNSYTQFYPNVQLKPLDYDALTLCMRKINQIFSGLHIGLPKIGAGLAGGNWEKIKEIIQKKLSDCNITVIIYEK